MPTLRLRAFFSPLVFAAVAQLTATPLMAQPATTARPYDVESGVIVLHKSTKNTAVTIESVDTVYFSDWGRVRATWSTSKSSNRFVKGETVSRTMSLIDGAMLTTVNLDTQQGTRMRNPAAAMANMSRPDAQKMANQMAGAMNTKTSTAGDEQVAGRSCAVTEAVTDMGPVKMTTRVCTWKNIVLKTVSTGAGTETLEQAVSVTEGAVPADKMAAPKAATIREIGGRHI